MIVAVPCEETEVFWQYFECVWHMEAGDNWSFWYRKQNELMAVLMECGYFSTAGFQMLCRSHDIIYEGMQQ